MFLVLSTLLTANAADSPGTTDGTPDTLGLNIVVGANTPINCTVSGVNETPNAFAAAGQFNAGVGGAVAFGDTGQLPGAELRGFSDGGADWQVMADINVQCFTPGGTWDFDIDGVDNAGTATIIGYVNPAVPTGLTALQTMNAVPSANLATGLADGGNFQLSIGAETTASDIDASFTLTMTPN